MKTKIFCSLVALVLIFSACTKDQLYPGKADVSVATGDGTRSGAKLVWNGAADAAVAVNIDAVANDTRKNASGPKITSNAHSADFPGIYFIWDTKQKDPGYLKVAAWVFDAYESFVLTSKESNNYWDFPIAVQEGQTKTDDDCYVFFIPKVVEKDSKGKFFNINMVFISEFQEREIPCEYETVTVLFHSGNGAVWGYGPDAIIPMEYNFCKDGCFDEWLAKFTPALLWGDKDGYAEFFKCGFERWRMASYESNDAAIGCDPAIRIEEEGGKVVLIFAVRDECPPVVVCDLEPVDVWFYPMNDGIWGFDAIIKQVYNPCTDGCFEDWVKQFTPEGFWGYQPGFIEFMCTFDGWVMGKHSGVEPYYEELPWSCNPYIDGENSRPGVSIFAKHGENKCIPKSLDFNITVFHRVAETGAYLVYPGVGENFASDDEAYVEWLNEVTGFEFLNLYLAAIRNNDPASLSSVEGYVCCGVEKTGGDLANFILTKNGDGEDITALINAVNSGHYEITFWYNPEEVEEL